MPEIAKFGLGRGGFTGRASRAAACHIDYLEFMSCGVFKGAHVSRVSWLPLGFRCGATARPGGLRVRPLSPTSLVSLLECPSINTIQELQTELGTLKNVELNPIQLRKIVKWIQRQSQTLVYDSDVGSKRLHPSNSLPPVASQHVRRLEAGDASTLAVLPAADGGSLPDVFAELAAAELAAADLAGRIEDETRKFMEMM